MNALLAPSLLSADLANLGHEAEAVRRAGVTWLHLDVMDGRFVPNISYGPPVIASLRRYSGLFFDAHLMVLDPMAYIQDFVKAGADIIVPHIEAVSHAQRTLEAIRDAGVRAGIALNPDTEVSRLRYLLPYLDMILIMGVNPGFSGQKFLPLTLAKIRDCRLFLEDQGYEDMPIEVDGGADAANAGRLVESGANVLVSGSAFFRHEDYSEAASCFAKAVDSATPGPSTLRAMEKVRSWRRKQ